jgi:poly(beta-D-mannuronate) lyase
MIKVVLKRPALLFILVMSITEAMATLVYNQMQLNEAIKNAKPGDTIFLDANTKWHNVHVDFEANGTKDKNIVLTSSTNNKIQLTGNSWLKLAGEYLTVSNLHFTNGFSTDRAVIEFRNKNKLANYCRVTHCAITNYSKPKRFDTDSWIIFWGKQNRFDHNLIGDKLNGGTTLIVELNDERSQNNQHLIDSNHFATRSRLGSNGGETIRIGVSRYSMTSSATIIKDNLFEKCSGEVEIISVKSCNNTIAYNTFFECEGGVVLRHGQNNKVTNNIFIGNNKPNTGGVRIIDSGHVVSNNLFIGLAGNRFRSALTVMNAVPNSLPNRYLQVKNVSITNNMFINCSRIVFGEGKDVERTLAPQNVLFANNFITGNQSIQLVDNNEPLQTIKFNNNTRADNQNIFNKGFVKAICKRVDGIYALQNLQQIQTDLAKFTTHTLDYHWLNFNYTTEVKELKEEEYSFTATKVDSLITVVKNATGICRIKLASGIYALPKELQVAAYIHLDAAKGTTFVNATDKSLYAFITILKGGSVSVNNIVFEANHPNSGDVQNAIAVNKDGILSHYTITANNCTFKNFNEGGYSCIKGTKNSYADKIEINNCVFENNAGVAIDFAAEKDDKGIYNVEALIVSNSIFTNHLGPAINIYRGGNDESTTGPAVLIEHCVFNNVDNREQSYVIKLMGVQKANVNHCIFNNSGLGGRSIWFEEYSWDDVKVNFCNFYNSGRVQSFYGKLFGNNNYKLLPQFIDAEKGNFKLIKSSPLLGKGFKKNIGLL